MSVLDAPEVAAGKIWRVTRAALRPTCRDEAEVPELLRPGHLADRTEADPPAWRPLGAAAPHRHRQASACHVGDSLTRRRLTGRARAVDCEYTWKGNWGPRIGATYDIKGDGKSKIFASWGRFFAKVPNDLAARALAADAGISRGDYYDANLTQPIPDGVPAAGVTQHYSLAGDRASKFADNTKSTYQDEFLGGVQFAVAGNINIGLAYLHRTIPVVLEDYQPGAIVAYDLGCPGLGRVEYFIDNISSSLPKFTCQPTATITRPRLSVSQAAFEDPAAQVRGGRAHGQQELLEQLVARCLLPLGASEGQLRGLLPQRQRPVRPRDHVAVRLPDERPELHRDRRPPVRLSRRRPLPGQHLGCGVLPNDRTHQVKLYGNYTFGAINVGSASTPAPASPSPTSPPTRTTRTPVRSP